MKRIVSLMLIVATVISCASVMGILSLAAEDTVTPNPAISVGVAFPTLDGVINDNEGWSKPALVNDGTTAPFYRNGYEITTGSSSKVYFAMNHTGLYFAADIVDGVYFNRYYYPNEVLYNDFIYSEDTDWIDLSYGWDGDVFGLMLDPASELLDMGYTGTKDRPPMYLIGLFKKEGLKMYRQNVNRGDITDRVFLEGGKTKSGWTIEGCIPWSVITDDIFAMTKGEINLDLESIMSEGAVTRASAVYIDRYFDKDAEDRATLNYFATVPSVQADGALGHMGTGDNVLSLGLQLVVSSENSSTEEHIWTEWERVLEPEDEFPGYEMSYCPGCGKTRLKFIFKTAYQNKFKDVNTKAWYADEVEYCVKFGYMSGMSNYRFAPNSNLTREQFVVILANYAGIDTDEYKYVDSGMKDVPTGKWYSGAVTWAVEAGYISGVAEGRFGLGQDIQRAALARLLYLFADSMGLDTSARADLSGYNDFNKLEPWMNDGLRWAVHEGLISSTSDQKKLLSPKATATRAQTARMLMLFDEYMYRQLGVEIIH